MVTTARAVDGTSPRWPIRGFWTAGLPGAWTHRVG